MAGDIRQARSHCTHVLERAGWGWGPSVLAAIGAAPEGGGIGLSPLTGVDPPHPL